MATGHVSETLYKLCIFMSDYFQGEPVQVWLIASVDCYGMTIVVIKGHGMKTSSCQLMDKVSCNIISHVKTFKAP